MNTNKVRVLSGIRASHESLHIGNLFGALDGMIALQNDPMNEAYYMVADLHGITTDFDPKILAKNRLEVAKDMLAAGIDPNKCVFFLQADVPEHIELAYLLSSLSHVSELMRMPSKKNEYKKYADSGQLTGVSIALLGYPVLMAADILLYKAKKVPIGIDQLPHLEFARKVARRLNKNYGLDFPVPKAITTKEIRVPSLTGKGKMSKSSPEGAIFLKDSLEEIQNKVSKIPTDSGRGVELPTEGGVFALFTLIELVQGLPRRKEVENKYLGDGVKYSEVKKDLARDIYSIVKPIQDRRKELDNNPEKLQEIINMGAARARVVANKTLNEVKRAMGLMS